MFSKLFSSDTENRNWAIPWLVFIILLSTAFHLFSIGFPDRPVFDEVHFTTYAVAYADHRAHVDIHPAFGKLIYAFALTLFPEESYTGRAFLEFKKNSENDTWYHRIDPEEKFGVLPYKTLRTINAIFGIILPILVFAFLKTLTKEDLPALLGAFFIVFENALLLETRLILLNGFFLVFGLAGLILYFKSRPRPFLAGILWGLALSVKLIAVVFLGPLIAALLITYKHGWREEFKKAAIFTVTGLIVLSLFIGLANNLLMPVNDRLIIYKNYANWSFPDPEKSFSSWPAAFRKVAPYLQTAAAETLISLSGYTGGVKAEPINSNWYAWPLMWKPFSYLDWSESGGPRNRHLVLFGNPIVWLLGTVFVFLAAMDFFRSKIKKLAFRKTSFILLFGYIFSLLPFILIVRRATFLYHYFPALIFAVCLAAIGISDTLKNTGARTRKTVIVSLVALVVFSFLVIAPYTYGL